MVNDMERKPTSKVCGDCEGSGGETNTLMIPKHLFSDELVPAEEHMPCHRCDGSGKVYLCPECGLELFVDPGYADTREEPGQPPALVCKGCDLEFDESE